MLDLNSSSRGPAFAGMRGVRGAARAAARNSSSRGWAAQNRFVILVCLQTIAPGLAARAAPHSVSARSLDAQT